MRIDIEKYKSFLDRILDKILEQLITVILGFVIPLMIRWITGS